MGTISISIPTQSEWTQVVEHAPKASLVQSWAYGDAKAATSGFTIERLLLTWADGRRAAVQAQIKLLPVVRRGVVWVNRAPLALNYPDDAEPEATSDALRALYERWVAERGLLLRIGLPVAEEGGARFAADPFQMINPSGGWASSRVSLSGDMDALRKTFDSTWRRYLTKSEKAGMEVGESTSRETLTTFCGDYQRFLTERGFSTSVTPELLLALETCSGEQQKPLVFTASMAGRPIAAILMARYGQSAEYLASTTSEEGKALNAAKLLFWRAMLYLKQHGYSQLDLGGMHPTVTPKGIYEFKAGLNGRPYQYMGVIEAGGSRLINRVIKRFLPK